VSVGLPPLLLLFFDPDSSARANRPKELLMKDMFVCCVLFVLLKKLANKELMDISVLVNFVGLYRFYNPHLFPEKTVGESVLIAQCFE